MKSTIKNLAAFLSGALAIVSLSSCLEQESTTKLTKEGSGTITESITIGAQMAGMINAQAAEGGGNEFTNEETYKDKAAKMGEGVEFVSLKKEDTKDGSLKIVANYKFADINKLKASMSDDKQDNPITFVLEKGDTNKLTITMPKKDAGEEGADDEAKPELSDAEKAQQKQQLQMMAGMMKGMRMASFLEIDGEITKTDADFANGNKITLYDLELGKIFTDEKTLAMLNSPDDMNNVETLRKLSKEVKGLKIEADDKIVVEFK